MRSKTNPPARESFSARNYTVDKWEERDNLQINLRDARTDNVIISWSDEDARQLFQDGYFDVRKLKDSVIDYAHEMGIIPVRKGPLKMSGRNRTIPLRERDRQNPPRKGTQAQAQRVLALLAQVLDVPVADWNTGTSGLAFDSAYGGYRLVWQEQPGGGEHDLSGRMSMPKLIEQMQFVSSLMWFVQSKSARKNPPVTTRAIRAVGGATLSNSVKELRYRHAKGAKRLYKHTFGAGVSLFGMPDGSLLLRGARKLWENRTVGDDE